MFIEIYNKVFWESFVCVVVGTEWPGHCRYSDASPSVSDIPAAGRRGFAAVGL